MSDANGETNHIDNLLGIGLVLDFGGIHDSTSRMAGFTSPAENKP